MNFSGFDEENINEIKALLRERFGHSPTAFVRTFGCQQNVSDSERLRGVLAGLGFGFTQSYDSADFILFNTCAVRAHAEDRVYGQIGALKAYKKARKNAIIAVCGCMTQQSAAAKKIRETFPFVDLIFGVNAAHLLPKMLCELLTGSERVFNLQADGEIAEGLPINRDGDLRGWLPVMYGCDNFCSYCVVPYVRGRERSRRQKDILREAEDLIQAGFKDIVLLGQNVNSYGKGLTEPADFAGLLRRVCALPGEFTVRFMTSHPKDCTRDLLLAMSECEKAARHLHLPFQSGSDRILAAMNRGYGREHYISLISAAREFMPDLAVTGDVIVGFPGETEEDFLGTLSLIKEVEFNSLYTFIYSPREGTPAAKLPDHVTHLEKTERMARLLRLQEEIAARKNEMFVGKTVRALCEKSEKDGIITARTGQNQMIEVPGGWEHVGKFERVTVTASGNYLLKGEFAN
ncbi:MAG: tRNA (N6-isopentenyl adenosine(37)-C2)-methylthiotransferase MiaB [Oscillospiraceae bacterium]|nr:tRNA (N6-isopentenyl adenosine(37)-C2)-methylthiotransferase MiaB [Oscillospiraceae bacterium]